MKKNSLIIFFALLSILSIFTLKNKENIKRAKLVPIIEKYIFPYKQIDKMKKSLKNSKHTRVVLTNFIQHAVDNDLSLKKSLTPLKFKKTTRELIFEDKKINIAEYKPYENIIMRGINNVVPGSAFLDKSDDNLFLLSASGILAYSDLNSDETKFMQIKNNINDFIGKKQLDKYEWFSIKDLLIFNGKIYVSYTNEQEENCWNTSIIYADLNYQNLKFEPLFEPNVCIGAYKNVDNTFNSHQSGGRIISLDEKNLLFSTGDFRNRFHSQDLNSPLGKLLKINLDDKSYSVAALGHRNIQGLYFDKKNSYIISTEHGPKGGDEVNLLSLEDLGNGDNPPNHGWAISSYGEHYSDRLSTFLRGATNHYEKYPLYKSHEKYGFVEPIKYYVPSIGISELVPLNPQKKLYLHTSLKDSSIYLFQLDQNNIYKNIAKVKVGERIRDVVRFRDKIVLFLEDTSSVATIDLKELRKIVNF